jgi:hypothetical protein
MKMAAAKPGPPERKLMGVRSFRRLTKTEDRW